MQPKDRPNGWAFLGTSLPLLPLQDRVSLSLCLNLFCLVLPLAPIPLSFPALSADAPYTPTFHFPAGRVALPALQA